jgi:selenocysteine lyase/cysteine desulfurase
VSDRALERGDHPLHPDLHGATWTDPDAFELAPDARRFETWEFSAANVLGLGAAARYALDVGIETARDRARALAEEARARLAELPGVRPLDRGAERCAIATFEVAGRDADEVKLALRARGINTSAADRSAAVIDMDAKGAATLLRASPHYYNTSEEIERLAEALGELLR